MATSTTTQTQDRSSRMHRIAVHAGASARPISGRRFFPLYGVIHHIGRVSGSEYSTPVVVRGTKDGVYVPLPFGERTNWYRNAIAAGGVRATWKGRDHWFGNARLVAMDDTDQSFTRAMRAMMRLSGVSQVVRFDPIS